LYSFRLKSYFQIYFWSNMHHLAFFINLVIFLSLIGSSSIWLGWNSNSRPSKEWFSLWIRPKVIIYFGFYKNYIRCLNQYFSIVGSQSLTFVSTKPVFLSNDCIIGSPNCVIFCLAGHQLPYVENNWFKPMYLLQKYKAL